MMQLWTSMLEEKLEQCGVVVGEYAVHLPDDLTLEYHAMVGPKQVLIKRNFLYHADDFQMEGIQTALYEHFNTESMKEVTTYEQMMAVMHSYDPFVKEENLGMYFEECVEIGGNGEPLISYHFSQSGTTIMKIQPSSSEIDKHLPERAEITGEEAMEMITRYIQLHHGVGLAD